MNSLGDLLGRVMQAVAAMLPAALAWLAGRRGAQAAQARDAAETLQAQNDIAARPHEPPDRLAARMRDGSL